MIQVDPGNPANAIIPFVRNWFVLLAESKSTEACQMLDEPNCYGIVWTPESIDKLVREVFAEDTIFYREFGSPRFSDPNRLASPRLEPAGEFDDGSGYWFDHPVPLNDEWSDLTAQFEFKKRKNGFAVVLHDLHVL